MIRDLNGKCYDCSGLEGNQRQRICRGEAGLSPLKRWKYLEKWLEEGRIVESTCLQDATGPATVPIRPSGVVVRSPSAIGVPSKPCKDCREASVPSEGPGTELLAIYKAANMPACQQCRDLALKMDRWGVGECRRRMDEIVADILPRARAWMAEKHPWAHALFGGAVEDAAASLSIRRDVKKAIEAAERKKTQKSRASQKHRGLRAKKHSVQPVQLVMRRPIKWAVCFTIAPRKAVSWPRAVASCRAAGWDPVCFAEPGVQQQLGVEWIQRPETIAPSLFPSATSGDRCGMCGPDGQHGAHQNYMQALADTLAANPDAEMILYAQDDSYFPPGSKEFLESMVWPTGIPLISLWCPSGFSYQQQQPGLCRTPSADIIGGVAFVMPRATAEFLVSSKFMHEWQGNKHKSKGFGRRILDIATGRALATIGKHALYFTHSIVDHFEPVFGNSSIGNGGNTGYRISHQYVGDGATCGDIARRYGVAVTSEPVHVVIPSHEGLDLTLSCIAAVKTQGVPVHICYVDNGSCSETVRAVRDALRGTDHSVICNRSNSGFTKAVQQGIDQRQGRHVMLLNNDCRMQPGCLAAMLAELSGKTASVCPVTNDRGVCSIRHVPNQVIKSAGTSRTVDVLPWFCCLLSREALEIVDQLPTAPELASGLGVDDWWSLELRKKGWKHVVTGRAFAEHDHSSTFKSLQIDRSVEQRKAVQWLQHHSR